MSDLALELAQRIIAGGNFEETVRSWAADAVEDASETKKPSKGGK